MSRKDEHGGVRTRADPTPGAGRAERHCFRHAAIASVFALAITGLGIILVIVGNQLYEQASGRVLWALAGARAVLGV
jgi:hypothetical protein